MRDEQWRRLPLGECLTLQRGFDLSAADRKLGSIPVVSSSGITGYHSLAPVRGPGVVTGRYGTIGEVFYLEQDFWPLNTTLWVKDFKGNNPKFASLLLRTIDFRSCSDKSSVPGVNRNDLHCIQVDLPPVGQQRAIVEVLSPLDDKIELNRRMNRTLESMARAIFRSWFVDFDPVVAKAGGRQPFGMSADVAALFPGELVADERGEIPFGWRFRPLVEVTTKIGSGATPRGGSAVYLPQGTSFIRSQNVLDHEFEWSGLARITDEAAQDLRGVTVREGDVLLNITGDSILRTCVVDSSALPARGESARGDHSPFTGNPPALPASADGG
jgi:type I restriction enzyme S subunit